jgi:hypothetical protein
MELFRGPMDLLQFDGRTVRFAYFRWFLIYRSQINHQSHDQEQSHASAHADVESRKAMRLANGFHNGSERT